MFGVTCPAVPPPVRTILFPIPLFPVKKFFVYIFFMNNQEELCYNETCLNKAVSLSAGSFVGGSTC